MINNLKSTIYLIILIDLCCSTSNEISVRLQKGSYSNVNLCKSSTPIYERSARSAIECFKICQNLLGNNCKSFNYRWMEKSCSLYKDVIRYDYYEDVNGTCKGYQIMPDCPVGFKYLIEGNKCIKMMVGAWDWYTGRQLCNSLHPRSHPVIVDFKNDSLLFSRFFEKEIIPNCPNSLVQGRYTYWSAGFSPYVNGSRQQFQWSPFPGVDQPLKATTPWAPGEPNAYFSSDICIQSLYILTLDDYFCSFQICILCEIEMF